MQIKKFEAPTIQEALDTIKRELGPEAIILQTKQHKRGFGLMSRASVEVTAAVSERSVQKKKSGDSRLSPPNRMQMERLPATQQADFYDKNLEQHLEKAARATRDQVSLSRASANPSVDPRSGAPRGSPKAQQAAAAAAQQRLAQSVENISTPTSRPNEVRYADIDEEVNSKSHVPSRTGTSRSAESAGRAVPAGRGGYGQASNAAVASASGRADGMGVEEELRHLKRMIEEMKTSQDHDAAASSAQALARGNTAGALSTPALQDAFEQLVINGVDKRLALTLIRQVGFELGEGERAESPDEVLDHLAGAIMGSTQVLSPLAQIKPRHRDPQTGGLSGDGPLTLAIVGPTGVGKTTTIAKMASEALLKRGLRVGLINLDCYKVAAVDQLSTYAKILKAPFRSVSNVEELIAAVQDFASLDLVLIDTTGRSQRDPQSLKEMEQLLSAIPNLQSHLILAATTRDAELYDMSARFAVFHPQGIIVSKLDEAMIFGAVYNITQKTKLPLLYFTTGQRVPEDIEEASRERVVSLVMDL